LDFVEGCDFEEFSKYLTKLGLYTGEDELGKLEANLDSGFFRLIVFGRITSWLVMRFGMSRTLMSTGKGFRGMRLTGIFCTGFWVGRVILLSYMSSG
jgi:hypothetical protein